MGVARAPRRAVSRRARASRRWRARRPRGAARADRDGPLKQTLAGATVDWEAGTLAASAGAAADLRMPSVDLSRPGAQRRAQAAAVAKLRAALASLPLGAGNKLTSPEIERALGRARAVDVQYQSNGGAIVRVEIRFGDWLETPRPAPNRKRGFAVAVPAMHLGAAPTARIGKRDVRVGAAVYRITRRQGGQERRRCEGRQGRAARAGR